MRPIVKRQEPASLAAHRRSHPQDFEGYEDKATLRAALVDEQRGLCCYCMGRIKTNHNKMKVEHWRCQQRYLEDRLRYGNLLGACYGGEGSPPELQHCDTSKGELDLRWNPANPAHRIEARIRYDPDGRIRAYDPSFDDELNKVLHLNVQVLQAGRESVYRSVADWLRSEKARARGPIPRERLERARNRYSSRDGMLTPFSQVAVWVLDQRLARMVG